MLVKQGRRCYKGNSVNGMKLTVQGANKIGETPVFPISLTYIQYPLLPKKKSDFPEDIETHTNSNEAEK